MIDLAPPGEGDRQKAVSYFLQEGLGQGAAGNKAATYMLLGSKSPNEAPARTTNARPATDVPKKGSREPKKERVVSRVGGSTQLGSKNAIRDNGAAEIPLNVNLQIHIGADASTDQIEAIFSAMRRYLYDKQVG